MKQALLSIILGLSVACAEPDEGYQVELTYTTPADCVADLRPEYAPDAYYDKIEDLCGHPNEFEGPDPY